MASSTATAQPAAESLVNVEEAEAAITVASHRRKHNPQEFICQINTIKY